MTSPHKGPEVDTLKRSPHNSRPSGGSVPGNLNISSSCDTLVAYTVCCAAKFMGWDALALRNGEPLAMASKHWPDHWDIDDLPLKEVFASAAANVRDEAGCVSECLLDGQLSGIGTRAVFECIFAVSFRAIPDGELIWTPTDVCQHYENANWDVPVKVDQRMDALQIRAFVRICCENGLGIHFGW
ncbi:MAG: hypothetical protein AAF497_09285 [Planctomycetota bacterium]